MRARLLLLLLTGLVLIPAPVGRADVPQLVGTVGPGFTIELTDAGGAHVHPLRPGRYEMVVHDLSDEHNFVLGHKETGRRPVQTEVEFVGDVNVTVDLTPGVWVYACSPHFETMNGRFTVVAADPKPSPPRQIAATVTSTRVSLAPTRVASGRYVLTVTDRSASRGFHLVGPGIDRRTGKAYVGKSTWRVRLGPGTYRFGDQRRLVGRLVVR